MRIPRLLVPVVLFLLMIPTPAQAAGTGLDSGFGESGWSVTDAGGIEQQARVALDPAGRIVVVGEQRLPGTGPDEPADNLVVMRLLPLGDPDTSFDADGIAQLPGITTVGGVTVQDDGKIVIAGGTDDGDAAVARLDTVGTLDAGFGGTGLVTTDLGGSDTAVDVHIRDDDKIMVAAMTSTACDEFGCSTDFAALRYTSAGALDTSFGGGGTAFAGIGGFAQATSLVLTPDGGAVVGGNADEPSTGAFDVGFALVKFTSSGAPDAGFGSGGTVITQFPTGGFAFAIARGLAVDSQSRIVAAGSVDSGPGTSNVAVARYAANGALDPALGADGIEIVDVGAQDSGAGVTVQGDDKIVVGAASGNFDPANSSSRFVALRFNASGGLDPDFGRSGISILAAPRLPGSDPLARSEFQEPGDVALTRNGKVLMAGTVAVGSTDGFDAADLGVARITTWRQPDGVGGQFMPDFSDSRFRELRDFSVVDEHEPRGRLSVRLADRTRVGVVPTCLDVVGDFAAIGGEIVRSSNPETAAMGTGIVLNFRGTNPQVGGLELRDEPPHEPGCPRLDEGLLQEARAGRVHVSDNGQG